MPAVKILCDDDHVSRYCKPSAVDDNTLMPMAAAFELREDEEYLSVNWIECFEELNLIAAINKVQWTLQNKDLSIRSNGRFAVLGVKEIKAAISNVTRRVSRIEHMPETDDCSHCGVFGYSASDLEVASEIALQLAIQNVYPPTTNSR